MKDSTKLVLLGSFVMACGAAGCLDSGDDGDELDDSFAGADGKGDGYTVTEAEAQGVMSLADASTEAQLRSEVGLTARTAKQVAAYVAGPDRQRGTADDQQFDSLEELDAVPYVGSRALSSLVRRAHDAGLVRQDALGRHDVSVLFPLSDALWPASTPALGGPLLPPEVFAKIGESLVPRIEDAAEYAALRVVAARVDPCFQTALAAACQPQLRLVFQAIGTDGAHDGAVHALYNLGGDELAQVVDRLRAIAPAEHRAYRRLGVSPALSAQGPGGAYATQLRELVVAHAGPSNLARMTFMTRTESRQSQWRFGGVHIKAAPATGFPGPGKIQIVGSTETLQTVSNGGFGLSFNYGVTPSFADPAGMAVASSQDIPRLSQSARVSAHGWALRQQRPTATVPDTTDCASCHVAGHASRALEAAFATLATKDRGPRAITPAETASDNLRAFGYFGRDAHVAVRTANETAAVVRALSEQ